MRCMVHKIFPEVTLGYRNLCRNFETECVQCTYLDFSVTIDPAYVRVVNGTYVPKFSHRTVVTLLDASYRKMSEIGKM